MRLFLAALPAVGLACSDDGGAASTNGPAKGQGEAQPGSDSAPGTGPGSASGGGGGGGAGGSASGGGSSGSTPAPGAGVARSCAYPAPKGHVFYVATNGNDKSGDGTSARPYATLTAAVDAADDETTILVRAGTYTGRQRLDGSFAKGIVLRSEEPYQAKLRNSDVVVSVYQGQGITLEGFDIAHSGPGASPVVVHIQDLRGDSGGTDYVSRITLRNNVIHDSYNNDLIKLNNGAGKVTIEGNIFYNQSGSDEHIDVNSVTDVTIQDNIFFNDFEGSARTNGNDTSSYIVIKDSNDDDDTNLGSRRIDVLRNVFLNWQGNPGQGFLLVGEDGKSYYEARDVVVENNLFLGNSTNRMQSPFAVKGARDILFRHNTIAGNTPSRAFVCRTTREGENPVVENIRFYNNVWSDPTGTMERFSDTDPSQVSTFTLMNNDYWNSGKSIPTSAADAVSVAKDTKALLADPKLPAHGTVKLPRLASNGRLADGSASQCDAFEKIVNAYARPGDGSAVFGRSDPSQSPDHDILGRRRDVAKPSDLGAVQR